jgi:hypothetical protein
MQKRKQFSESVKKLQADSQQFAAASSLSTFIPSPSSSSKTLPLRAPTTTAPPFTAPVKLSASGKPTKVIPGDGLTHKQRIKSLLSEDEQDSFFSSEGIDDEEDEESTASLDEDESYNSADEELEEDEDFSSEETESDNEVVQPKPRVRVAARRAPKGEKTPTSGNGGIFSGLSTAALGFQDAEKEDSAAKRKPFALTSSGQQPFQLPSVPAPEKPTPAFTAPLQSSAPTLPPMPATLGASVTPPAFASGFSVLAPNSTPSVPVAGSVFSSATFGSTPAPTKPAVSFTDPFAASKPDATTVTPSAGSFGFGSPTPTPATSYSGFGFGESVNKASKSDPAPAFSLPATPTSKPTSDALSAPAPTSGSAFGGLGFSTGFAFGGATTATSGTAEPEEMPTPPEVDGSAKTDSPASAPFGFGTAAPKSTGTNEPIATANPAAPKPTSFVLGSVSSAEVAKFMSTVDAGDVSVKFNAPTGSSAASSNTKLVFLDESAALPGDKDAPKISFGTQPPTTTKTSESAPVSTHSPKDQASSLDKPATSGFGFGSLSSNKPATSENPAGGFGFGSSPAAVATDKPVVGFGSTDTPSATPAYKPVSSDKLSISSSPVSAPTAGGFGFGAALAKPTTSGGFGSSPTPATTDKPTGGFGFGSAPTTTDKPSGFSFGSLPAPSTAENPSAGGSTEPPVFTTSNFGSPLATQVEPKPVVEAKPAHEPKRADTFTVPEFKPSSSVDSDVDGEESDDDNDAFKLISLAGSGGFAPKQTSSPAPASTLGSSTFGVGAQINTSSHQLSAPKIDTTSARKMKDDSDSDDEYKRSPDSDDDDSDDEHTPQQKSQSTKQESQATTPTKAWSSSFSSGGSFEKPAPGSFSAASASGATGKVSAFGARPSAFGANTGGAFGSPASLSSSSGSAFGGSGFGSPSAFGTAATLGSNSPVRAASPMAALSVRKH